MQIINLQEIKMANRSGAAALLARIEWILKDRQLTHEKLGERAGLSSRSHLSSITHRLRIDPNYPAKMYLETYQKLAKGGRVSLNWLMFGEGTPDGAGPAFPKSEEYPNLNVAIRYEADRWSKATITAALAMNWDEDKTPKEWASILDKIAIDQDKLISSVSSVRSVSKE